MVTGQWLVTSFSLDPEVREWLYNLARILKMKPQKIIQALTTQEMIEANVKPSTRMIENLELFYERIRETLFPDSDLYDRLFLAFKLYDEGKGTLQEFNEAIKLIKETLELRRKARQNTRVR